MAVGQTNTQVRLRADEAERKAGVTFQDLCDLVDKGREAGITATAVVGDMWVSRTEKDRKGYRLRFVEV